MNGPDISAEVENAKPSCLVVFKFRLQWNHHLIRKLAIAYRITPVFVHEVFLKEGSQGLHLYLRKMAMEIEADVVIFDLDYYYLFDCQLIESLDTSAKKVLICFDDLVLHQINSINAAACDLVLTADPLSALKYREVGVAAEYFALEASKEDYFDRNVTKEIDVLFFGSLHKADRREFVEYLRARGIDLRLIGPGGEFVPAGELAQYVSRSKIVVNFSKTDYSETTDLGIGHVRQYYLQFKGRVIEAGLCRTACVSEYSPSLRLLFSNREVPDFNTPEQCYDALASLLQDQEKLRDHADRLYDRVMGEFEDSVQIWTIKKAIDGVNADIRQSVAVPLWYWRLALKSKIRMLDRSPGLVLREISYVLRASAFRASGLKLLFFLEICAWIPWHYCERLAAKFGRTRLTGQHR